MAEEMKMAPAGSIEAKDPFAAVPPGYSLQLITNGGLGVVPRASGPG